MIFRNNDHMLFVIQFPILSFSWRQLLLALYPRLGIRKGIISDWRVITEMRLKFILTIRKHMTDTVSGK